MVAITALLVGGVIAAVGGALGWNSYSNKRRAENRAIREQEQEQKRENEEEAERLRVREQQAADDLQRRQIRELQEANRLEAKQLVADKNRRQEFYRSKLTPFGEFKTIKDDKGIAIADKYTFNPTVQNLLTKEIGSANLARDEEKKLIKLLGEEITVESKDSTGIEELDEKIADILTELFKPLNKTPYEELKANPLIEDLDKGIEETYQQRLDVLRDRRISDGDPIGDASHQEAKDVITRQFIKARSETLLGATVMLQDIDLRAKNFQLQLAKGGSEISQRLKAAELNEASTLVRDRVAKLGALRSVTPDYDVYNRLINRRGNNEKDVPLRDRLTATISNKLIASQKQAIVQQSLDYFKRQRSMQRTTDTQNRRQIVAQKEIATNQLIGNVIGAAIGAFNPIAPDAFNNFLQNGIQALKGLGGGDVGANPQEDISNVLLDPTIKDANADVTQYDRQQPLTGQPGQIQQGLLV